MILYPYCSARMLILGTMVEYHQRSETKSFGSLLYVQHPKGFTGLTYEYLLLILT